MKDDDRGDGDLGRGADQDVHERNENLRVRQEESFSEVSHMLISFWIFEESFLPYIYIYMV